MQGTPAASNPAVPSMPVTDGDIQAGDAEVYCPVFVINLDGINVTGVDIIPPMMDDMSTINKYLSQLQSYHDKKTLTPTDLGIRNGVWESIANNSYKTGKTIHLNMEIYTTATIVANYVYDNVFTIPSQYRPLNDTIVNAIASDGAYKNAVACTAMVKENGNLFICIPKATNNYLFIDAEWEIK